jgi:hypothetical protein
MRKPKHQTALLLDSSSVLLQFDRLSLSSADGNIYIVDVKISLGQRKNIAADFLIVNAGDRALALNLHRDNGNIWTEPFMGFEPVKIGEFINGNLTLYLSALYPFVDALFYVSPTKQEVQK